MSAGHPWPVRESDLSALGKVAFILKGWPRLSETFIAQEIAGLERAGLGIELWSLRHPTDTATHPVHRAVTAHAFYLPEYLHEEPGRVVTAWRKARRQPGYRSAYEVFFRDLARDRTRNRVRRFGQACVLAAELDPAVTHLHAHFLHTPASVARYAAMMRGGTWSVSAHAKDIWTIPEWEKAEKLNEARFAVTCTRAGAEHLNGLCADASRVTLSYHGIDLAAFAPNPAPPSWRDGSRADDPVTLLSVGRAVAKKGYGDLLDALKHLPDGLHWRLVHLGGGPLLPKLKAQARVLGLDARIEWRGKATQEEVLAALRAADLFVLPARVHKDGDRDGLPNVLMEAMSQRLPIVSTALSGIPELIVNGENGLLIKPVSETRDHDGFLHDLARAMTDLMRDPDRRHAMGREGEAHVRRRFAMEPGLDTLARLFADLAPETAKPKTARAS